MMILDSGFTVLGHLAYFVNLRLHAPTKLWRKRISSKLDYYRHTDKESDYNEIHIVNQGLNK